MRNKFLSLKNENMREIIFIICFIITSFMINAQGLIFDKEAFDKGIKYEKNRADRIPDKYSLKAYCPYILRQQRATCVAYSIASAIAIMNAKKDNIRNQEDISVSLVSPHWIYYRNKGESDENCMDGLNIEKTMVDVLNNGAPYIAVVEFPDYYPFTEVHLCNYYPPLYSKDKEIALLNKPDEIYRIAELDDLKAVISKGMPVVAALNVPPSFEKSKGKSSWTPLKTESLKSGFGHAVDIVAYDDTKNGGSFELMNSWGEEWGINGYIWVKYSDFMKCFIGGYAFYKEKKLGSDMESIDKLTENETIVLDKNLTKKLNSKLKSNKKWRKLKFN